MWRNREAGDDAADAIAIAAQLVTVSYNEAGRLLDGGEQVDAVPLAQEIRAWMEPFVAEHYKPEPKRKSRRNDSTSATATTVLRPRAGNESLMSKTMNRKPDPAAPDERPLLAQALVAAQARSAARRAASRTPKLSHRSPTAPATALAEPAAERQCGCGAAADRVAHARSRISPRFSACKRRVDDALKRAALKTLLRDPRFNVMDGLDIYIDDYTRDDPIPESVLRRMAHAQQFLDARAS